MCVRLSIHVKVKIHHLSCSVSQKTVSQSVIQPERCAYMFVENKFVERDFVDQE